MNNQLKLKESFPFFMLTKFQKKMRSGPPCLALDALVLLPGLLCHPDDGGDAEICVCGGGAPGCFNGSTESEEMRTNKQITEKMSSLPTVSKIFRLSHQTDEHSFYGEVQ